MSRCVLSFMTRSEITHAIHAALRRSNRPLTLVGLRALPFAWELRLEDADGVAQVLTLHQDSMASIERAISEVFSSPSSR